MSAKRQMTIDGLFRDEKGITTVAMALSIMVSLALVFTSAQVYKTTSAAAEVQEVADACALAAESEVAEFMICVKVCDAVVLSMSLLAGTAFGLGVVCACVPPLESVSSTLIKIGGKTLKARSSFAEKAAKGLNKLQDALPFLAAAAAVSVADANKHGAMQADYIGSAILLPQKGERITIGPADDLESSAADISDEISDIQEKAREAEEAAEKAQAAKEAAFELDCGNSPGYCQHERAGRFSWMPPSDNPMYSSVDAWSFSVALDRAKAYYTYRKGRETEPSGSVGDKASYHVRMKFYSYAYDKLASEGFVNEGDSSFSANFPKLYRNTAEFRQTSLYTTASFPVSYKDGNERGVMHAWTGCPAASGDTSSDCIAALDSGVYSGCETCNFSVESLGNVASASTNISNGFEYHYERIRQEAEKYKEAIDRANPLKNEVEEIVEPLLGSLSNALKDMAGCRISANPCGSIGCVAIVVNKADAAADSGFESLFVGNAGTLGARVAVSGAALLEDTSDDSSNVINSLFDGFAQDGGAAVGGARIALDCWSWLLRSYERGQASIEKALSEAISDLSLGTLTGLGDWAAKALEGAISSIGLEPANLNALKPAVLNTGHVTSDSNDAFSINYRKARSQSLSMSSSSGGLFSGLSSWASEKIKGLGGSEITIAEIDFPIGDSKIPIVISLPGSIAEVSGEVVSGGIQQIEALVSSASGTRVWQ